MKFIFGKIWLIWSALVFVATWPFVWLAYQFPYVLFPSEKKYAQGFTISKIWGKIVLFFIGVRLKVIGTENIDPYQKYVYVCNHTSQIDIPINFASHPELFVILSKKEAEKVPVVGTNLKYAHVTVNRKDNEDRKASLQKLNKHLAAGRSLLLYPEGRRNREDGHLSPFHTGAFVLAIQNQVPIVPVTIIGSSKVNNPTNPFAVYPGKIKVYFDQPIETKGLTKNDLEQLIETTRSSMLKHFTESN